MFDLDLEEQMLDVNMLKWGEVGRIREKPESGRVSADWDRPITVPVHWHRLLSQAETVTWSLCTRMVSKDLSASTRATPLKCLLETITVAIHTLR